jgi:uncharacterized protein
MTRQLHDDPSETEHGATVIIRHRILDAQQERYESWLDEIVPVCRAQPGYLDTQVIRPIAGFTSAYTIILRFSAEQYAHAWLRSAARAELIGRVRPMLQREDDYSVHSGIEFLFPSAAQTQAPVPTRWKQFLVTWSVIYPLVLVVPMVTVHLLRPLGLAGNRYVSSLLVTGIIVSLMVYYIMPRYTRLVHKWLYR